MTVLALVEDFDPVDPYKVIRIDSNDLDANIVCDICQENFAEINDEIVLCDLCNVATHQTCYGGDILKKVPTGQWFCVRCTELKANLTMKCEEIKCFLCPEQQGVLKKCSFNGKTVWAHSVCVNWTPEVWFADDKK